MIYITIGTQEPFNRLLEIMDNISGELCLQKRVIAQVSNSDYPIKYMQVLGKVSQQEFNKLIEEAELIISHAGMGSIISALVRNKPIIIFPRKLALKEHRNDHQMATAKKMRQLGYVHVADNESELRALIDDFFNGHLQPLHRIGPYASPLLLDAIEDFIISG